MTFPSSTLWGFFLGGGSLDIVGYGEMKLPAKLARDGNVRHFVGPEPALRGGLQAEYKEKDSRLDR